MSNKDFAEYEQSRLAYFESKAVVKAAILDGEANKTIEVISNCINKGLSIELTAEIVSKPIEYVKKIIQRLGLSNGSNQESAK
jgi:transcription initiation factor TFIIIB Brf1 subunit/transcription initiation factor TFIIB